MFQRTSIQLLKRPFLLVKKAVFKTILRKGWICHVEKLMFWFVFDHYTDNKIEPSPFLLGEDDLNSIELWATEFLLAVEHNTKTIFICLYSKSIWYTWLDNACYKCFPVKTNNWGEKTMPPSQTQGSRSLNPRGSVSRTTLSHTGVPWRELDGCSLLGSTGHQVARATATRGVGWKPNFWSSYLFCCPRGFSKQQRAGLSCS